MSKLFRSKNIIELISKLKEKNIPEKEYKVYIDRFLENKARRQGIPLTGNFELTPLCNLDCKMCYVRLNSHQFDKNDLLSTDTWKSLIKQAYEAGMRNATLTGGECLTYPGFDDVYTYTYGLGIIPSILSNGILMDEERVTFFKRYPPKMIQITVYGCTENEYERVTGKRVFSTVYNNILRLKDERIPVKISVTPNMFMNKDIRPLLDCIQGMNIPYNINANLIPPRENTGRKTYDISIDKYVELFKYKSDLNHQKLLPVDFSELPDENHSPTKRFGLLCGAGRSSFGIKYNGELCPCLSMDQISSSALDGRFIDAWSEINSQSNNYPLPEECGGCIYLDRCLPCIAMHKNSSNASHCDPRICERTKKLISAGFIPAPESNN